MKKIPISQNVIKDSFHENGFVILDNAISLQHLHVFRESVVNVIVNIMKKHDVAPVEKKGSLENYFSNSLILLREKNPELVSTVQRIISRTSEFFQLTASTGIYAAIRNIYSLESSSALYLSNNGIIFTYPNASDVASSINIELDWHKDTFYTVPKSQYCHIWIPIFYDATEEIGTLQVCAKSHKEGIGKQVFNETATHNHRYTVDKSSVENYDKVSVNVNLGQVLLFDGRLIHRSGHNASDKIRCTLIGLCHDVSKKEFEPFMTDYMFTKQTPEEYFYEIYNDERIKPYIDLSASPKGEPPGGV